MLKRIVAIVIVSMFVMCGIAMANEQTSSDIESKLDQLTEESAKLNGVLLKPHDDASLEPAPQNEVTEDLIERDVIPAAEAVRLKNQNWAAITPTKESLPVRMKLELVVIEPNHFNWEGVLVWKSILFLR